MIRVFLVFLLTTLLFTASAADNDTLKRAADLLKSKEKTQVFRAYNDYKNLYLQSILKNDDTLRYKALGGVVKSGNFLRIDVSEYEKELAALKKNRQTTKPAVTKNSVKSTPKSQKVTVTESHHLKNVRWEDGRLVLLFSRALSSKQLNYFKLYDKAKKRYRYVFDMHASMQNRQHNLRHKEIKRIRIAQFNPTTLRLVIENDKKLDLSFKRDGKEIVINLGVTPVVAPKAVAHVPSPTVGSKVIVIDPGHGGKDGGAVGVNRKYPEKRVVMNIASDLMKALKKQGHRVYLTRTNDKFIKLQKRTKFANQKKADLFVSIHANAVPKRNASKAHGVETYFLSNNVDAGSERAKRVAKMENSKDLRDVNFYGQQDFINILNREKIHKSERLAHDLQRNVLAELRKHYKTVKDAGVREGPFWILVGAQMPAILIEVGFITHPVEGKRLTTRTYQKRFANGMAAGIEQYFLKNP
jgi:N-acetylmuramoyl-L-alanine amidase